MARGTRTVYPSKRNKGLSSTFQPPEEGLCMQWPKRCDKHGDKDEDNSPKNVNNEIDFDELISAKSFFEKCKKFDSEDILSRPHSLCNSINISASIETRALNKRNEIQISHKNIQNI